MYCKKCQAEIKDTAKFCPVCGAFTNETPVTEELGKPKTRYCPKCQRKLAVGETVCAVCNSTENSEKPSKKAQRKRPAIRKGFLIAASLALIAVAVLGVLGYLMRDFLVGWNSNDTEKQKANLIETSTESETTVSISGTWGAGFTWTLLNDVVTISGTGVLSDWKRGFWDSRTVEVVMTEGVTRIGEYAFRNYSGITAIVLPDSVTSIGPAAFYDCTDLTSIDLSDSVTSIEDSAFSYCEKLTTIEIPDSVIFIGEHAFSHCTNLTTITIPNSVTSIEDSAFSYCGNLTTITIPNSVTNIGEYAFNRCGSLTEIIIPEGVTSIGCEAFNHCTSLTEITIPDSVTTIGENAFHFCTFLTDIYYTGTEEEWNAIVIDSGNDYLTSATIHFNS